MFEFVQFEMEVELPQQITETVAVVVVKLLPLKLKKLCDTTYKNFKTWCAQKKAEKSRFVGVMKEPKPLNVRH